MARNKVVKPMTKKEQVEAVKIAEEQLEIHRYKITHMCGFKCERQLKSHNGRTCMFDQLANCGEETEAGEFSVCGLALRERRCLLTVDEVRKHLINLNMYKTEW